MFIYIVIDDQKNPIGSFVNIEEARKHKKNNYKIIKSKLVDNNPVPVASNDNSKVFPDVINELFGGVKYTR